MLYFFFIGLVFFFYFLIYIYIDVKGSTNRSSREIRFISTNSKQPRIYKCIRTINIFKHIFNLKNVFPYNRYNRTDEINDRVDATPWEVGNSRFFFPFFFSPNIPYFRFWVERGILWIFTMVFIYYYFFFPINNFSTRRPLSYQAL